MAVGGTVETGKLSQYKHLNRNRDRNLLTQTFKYLKIIFISENLI
jgi:hypothetical protein